MDKQYEYCKFFLTKEQFGIVTIALNAMKDSCYNNGDHSACIDIDNIKSEMSE